MSLFTLFYNQTDRIIIFLTASFIVIIIGIRDDLIELSAVYKLGLQIIAVSVVLFGGDMYERSFYGILGIYMIPDDLAYPFTFFIGLFMINSYNLCDGIDGLAALMGIIIFSSYG